MSANKEDTLRQFCDVTGADEGRSRFFLESSNWQLDVALSSFYEHGGSVDEAPIPTATPASMPVLSDSDMESPPGSPLRQKKEKKKPASGNFATLDSLQQESSSDEDEASKTGWITARDQERLCTPSTSKDAAFKECCMTGDQAERFLCEEEIKRLRNEIARYERENKQLKEEIERLKERDRVNDTGQAFYAGGSERSGQQIIGPGKNRKDIVTEMFKSVRERGAVVFEDEPATASRGRGAFSGTGYRLVAPRSCSHSGHSPDKQQTITSLLRRPAQAQGGGGAGGARSVRLRLYREGYTVDAGAVRPYTDPDHAEFLNCIRRGEIPPELSGAGEVRVSLEDRRHEPAPRASAAPQAFAGKGHMLGSCVASTSGTRDPDTGGGGCAGASGGTGDPPAAAEPDREANTAAAQEAVGLDTAQPITTIQFRLADGSRVAGRFNHAHTVADLRAFVRRAHPGPRPFALLTSFPSAELSDEAVTVAQANLLNSTLLQRLK
ncbi:hypothetical protein MSG28_012775 [Choristoneura fumiferana]|uniref:Uncharacterized protein n=1 Tax=Choristoneura fumiferana TaxID=7141 RepID=A0ACC0JI62_CHOFU|nr:hypothetical protein MSG28_012775 [Choristoneura fumiferana]